MTESIKTDDKNLDLTQLIFDQERMRSNLLEPPSHLLYRHDSIDHIVLAENRHWVDTKVIFDAINDSSEYELEEYEKLD